MSIDDIHECKYLVLYTMCEMDDVSQRGEGSRNLYVELRKVALYCATRRLIRSNDGEILKGAEFAAYFAADEERRPLCKGAVSILWRMQRIYARALTITAGRGRTSRGRHP